MKWRLLTIQSVYIFVISIVIFLQQGVELPVHSMQEFCLETHFESWSLHRLHGDWKPQLGVLSQVQLERRGLALAKTDNRKMKMKMPPSEQVAGPALTSSKVNQNLHVNTFYHVTFNMYVPSNFRILFFPRTLCCMTHFLTFRNCYLLGSDLFVLGGGQNFDLFYRLSWLRV